MFAQKLARWTDLTAGFKGHPLSYDEAFERSKTSVLRFKWNYAVRHLNSRFVCDCVCVCTLLVLLPHPFLLVSTAVIIYVAGVLYADLPPSALRDAVPQAPASQLRGTSLFNRCASPQPPDLPECDYFLPPCYGLTFRLSTAAVFLRSYTRPTHPS